MDSKKLLKDDKIETKMSISNAQNNHFLKLNFVALNLEHSVLCMYLNVITELIFWQQNTKQTLSLTRSILIEIRIWQKWHRALDHDCVIGKNPMEQISKREKETT